MCLGSARLSDEYVTPPETPNVMGMNYILLSGFGENRTVPLNEPHRLWTLKEFNRKLPTVIMITGWASDNSIDSHRDLNNVWRAYKCRGNINFVVCSLNINVYIKCFSILYKVHAVYFNDKLFNIA